MGVPSYPQEGATVGAVVPCEPRESCEAGVGGGGLSAVKAHGCRSFRSHLEAPGPDGNREKARGLGGTPRHGRVLCPCTPALQLEDARDVATGTSCLVPFFSCSQLFPASRSFPVSQLFTSGGQSINSFSFIINPSNEYSGLISCRMDWFDLLAVQGTLKSLLQHHGPKPSVLQHSAFFMVQL